MLKKILLVFVALIVLAGCSGKITKDTLKENGVIDNFNGEALLLGMRKSDVDKIWGEPTMEGPDYLYDHEVLVSYTAGLATDILVEWARDEEQRWIAMHEITIGSSLDDLISKYGEPDVINDGTLGAGYSYVFEDTLSVFIVNDEKVDFILIANIPA